MQRPMRLVIAGGGTGGHLFPAVALAGEVMRRSAENRVLFVGSPRGIETRLLPRLGWPLETIEVTGLKGASPLRLARSLLRLPAAVRRSLAILRNFSPDVVLGVGGYASGPVLLAALALSLPTAIYDQNARAGATNRWLGRWVRKVYTAYPAAASDFPQAKVQLTGNPVREEVVEQARHVGRGDAETRRHGEGQREFTLLVFGGSQGARRINQTMMVAARHLAELQDRLFIIHQSGAADREEVRQGYREAAVRAEVRDFIEDMGRAYGRADLVICRAGAISLAELTLLKKPAILIPYPHAADDHQVMNARPLVEHGGALMIQDEILHGPLLASMVRDLFNQPARLEEMARRMGECARPDAARLLVDSLEGLMADVS